MFVSIFKGDGQTVYKQIFSVFQQAANAKVFRDYDFALFILPEWFNVKFAKHYIDKIFGKKPYLAFFSTFTATGEFFTDSALVALFFKLEEKEEFYIQQFRTTEEFKSYLSSQDQNNALHILFVPSPHERFKELFPSLKEGVSLKESTLTGIITGGNFYGKSYPLISNGRICPDGCFSLLTLKNTDNCNGNTISFKHIGPPFFFSSWDNYTIGRIDDRDARKFFEELLEGRDRLTPEYLTGFPMVLKPEDENSFPKVVRFPKEGTEKGILYWADVPARGEFHFIFLLGDKEKLRDTLKRKCSKGSLIWDFGLFFYCIGKAAFVAPEEELEFLNQFLQFPFLLVASWGEFTTYRGQIFWLNGSTTFSLMRSCKRC